MATVTAIAIIMVTDIITGPTIIIPALTMVIAAITVPITTATTDRLP
jgi:hypothetical protein